MHAEIGRARSFCHNNIQIVRRDACQPLGAYLYIPDTDNDNNNSSTAFRTLPHWLALTELQYLALRSVGSSYICLSLGQRKYRRGLSGVKRIDALRAIDSDLWSPQYCLVSFCGALRYVSEPGEAEDGKKRLRLPIE